MGEPPRKKARAPSYKIEIAGDETHKAKTYEMIKTIKHHMLVIQEKGTTNGDIIQDALSHYISVLERVVPDYPGSVVEVKKDKTSDMTLFLSCAPSLQRCIALSELHGRFCDKQLKIKKQKMKGHVMYCRLKCSEKHEYRWSSSPYIMDTGLYLINQRLMHGLVVSGMLPSLYERFTNAAAIGCIDHRQRSRFLQDYRSAIDDVYIDSIKNARFQEIAMKSYQSDDQEPMDILTDARHCWRKNAKDSTIVALGDLSHKVVACQHISTQEEPISQKHEKLGSERIYEELNKDDIAIGVWAHDFNSSINKLIKEKPSPTQNQNETWHGVKNLKKELCKVTKGPKYQHGKTWHSQLEDKVAPIATHVQYSIRSCDGNPQILKESMDNIVEHYQNNHENCKMQSRCRKDTNYEPSRTQLTDPKARELLKGALRKSLIYRNPENFALGKDTYYVESFNNSMLIFQDKRISFTSAEYLSRNKLSVIHWNDNVDRTKTSEFDCNKTVSRAQNYGYQSRLWKTFMRLK